VLAEHPTRRANVVGFDKDIAVKGNLAIVSAICALQLPDGNTIHLVIHEAIYNPTADHSLLSDFQLREYGTKIDAVATRHGGKQQMQLRDGTIIPLDLKGCLVNFQHRALNDAEVSEIHLDTLPDSAHHLTPQDAPWKPHRHNDATSVSFMRDASITARKEKEDDVIASPHRVLLDPPGSKITNNHQVYYHDPGDRAHGGG